LELFFTESFLFFSHSCEVIITKISLTLSLEKISQKLFIVINETIDLFFFQYLVREFAITVALITLAGGM